MGKRKKYLIFVIAACLMIVTAVFVYAARWSVLEARGMSVQTVIIHTNDSHGRTVYDESGGCE